MKHMKLMALVALGVMVQSVHARNESGWMKKTVHVLFYAGLTCGGWKISNFMGLPGAPGQTVRRIKNYPIDNGSRVLAGLWAFYYGLKGLDKELRITAQFKK